MTSAVRDSLGAGGVVWRGGLCAVAPAARRSVRLTARAGTNAVGRTLTAPILARGRRGPATTQSDRTAFSTSPGSGRTWKLWATLNQRTVPSRSITMVAGFGTSCPPGPPAPWMRP